MKKTKSKKWLARNRQALFILLFAVIGVALLWKSFAASPNKTTAFHLTNEYIHNSPNPSAPLDCLNEDDSHERDYSGSLNGSFSATEQLCNGEYSGGIYWSSGGIGLRAEAWVTGTGLTDMTVTSPTGVVHHAVLVGTSTATKGGKTTYHYQTCFVPPYALASDTGGTSLSDSYPGDPWTYTISGAFSNAVVHFVSQMTDVTVQQTYCPTSEQYLV